MTNHSDTSTDQTTEPRHQKGKPWEKLIGRRDEWHYIATDTELHARPTLADALKLARGIAYADGTTVQVSRVRKLFGRLAGTTGEPVYVSIA